MPVGGSSVLDAVGALCAGSFVLVTVAAVDTGSFILDALSVHIYYQGNGIAVDLLTRGSA